MLNCHELYGQAPWKNYILFLYSAVWKRSSFRKDKKNYMATQNIMPCIPCIQEGFVIMMETFVTACYNNLFTIRTSDSFFLYPQVALVILKIRNQPDILMKGCSPKTDNWTICLNVFKKVMTQIASDLKI